MMQINEDTPVIDVIKSPSGEPIADRGVPDDTTGAAISNINQDGQGVSVQINEAQAAADAVTIEAGLETPVDIELPEEIFAGHIPAGMTRGLLKFLRSEEKHSKTFTV